MAVHSVPLADRLLGYKSSEEVLRESGDKHSEIGRTPFERDVDRIKYTPEFRRLKDVTQVARAGETYLYHDRLSHSLKVAQVGRRLAEFILRVEANGGAKTDDAALAKSIELENGEGQQSIDSALRRQLDPDTVEAACLAHDLGHPPFGHLAEEELDKLLQEKTNDRYEPRDPEEAQQDPDTADQPQSPSDFDEVAAIDFEDTCGIRFEGNAQSFRILTRLASYSGVETGLGLTLGSLNGVLKYPYGRGEWIDDGIDEWSGDLEAVDGRSRGKFGYYKTEAQAFDAVRQDIDTDRQTIVAEIMDYADDLTYAIHDLTDFYMDGRLPLDRLLREASEEQFEHVERRELDNIESAMEYDGSDVTPTDVMRFLSYQAYSVADPIFHPYQATEEQKDGLEQFTSYLITRYLNNIYYPDRSIEELREDKELFLTLAKNTNNEYHLEASKRLEGHIDALQDLTEYYVIQDTALMGQQRGQRQVIRELFRALYDEAGSDPNKSAIPQPYSGRLQDDAAEQGFRNETEQRARIVADLISNMTENQAVEFHKRLTGDTPGSLQNEILR
ncbi:dGTP triphosphohydrolase [Haloarcula sp. H-GB5]